MKTAEVANNLVQWCRTGQYEKAYNELYDENAVSKEMPGMPNPVTEGKNNIIKEFHEWQNSIEEMHGGDISDPLIADNFFSVRMTMDATFKDRGRQKMDEICLYKVKDGKITEASFHYEA